jgi:hypothetical protein
VCQAILAADREAQGRFSGHGSALAQGYNHVIMPLANTRDKRTQILWGIRDFEHRLQRKPEGMWLAETAVDLETLDLLAEQGIRFTLLAPRQAHRVRNLKGGHWCDVSGNRIDPKVPYLCKLPSGRSIALFFYDGPISQDLAFGGLLYDGADFARRLLEAYSEDGESPELVHIATDGESYGHHHRNGDMALAYCLHHIESKELARLTVYGEFLEKYPPTQEVKIHENSSWSCIHGIDWNQSWRAPLRKALDWLRDALAPAYEKELGSIVQDPWGARDEYIEVVLDRKEEAVREFLKRQAGRDLSFEQQMKALKLLELQRHAMLMYTSCGWFFDEISGIETVQVMQYAARAMQLGRQTCGLDLESELIERLRAARSNLAALGTGAATFEKYVKPAELDLLRVGTHYAISSLFEEYPKTAEVFSYTAQSEEYEREEAGRQRLAVGTARIRSDITWDQSEISFAVLHLGDHNVIGGVREFVGDEAFAAMKREVQEVFRRSDIPEVIRCIDQHFGEQTSSLWHLFRDEQRAVLDRIRYSTLDEVEISFRTIYQNNYSMMNFLHNLNIPLPRALRAAAGYTVGSDVLVLFRDENMDVGRLRELVDEATRWSLDIDSQTVGYLAGNWINERMEWWAGRG